MLNLRKNIKLYILLIAFLSVCFPIQEFFHDHHFVEECFNLHTDDEDDHHSLASSVNKQKCDHEYHFSETSDKDFCFFVHVSKSFTLFDVPHFYFIKNTFDVSISENVVKVFSSHVSSIYLRGPPHFIS